MGDKPGHPFRGNQWTTAFQGPGGGAAVSRGDWREKILGSIQSGTPRHEYEQEKLQDIFESGRFEAEGRVSQETSFGPEYKVKVRPILPEKVERIPPQYPGDDAERYFDPKIVSLNPEYVKTGQGLMFKLNPGYADSVDELTKAQPGKVFRGLSSEEMAHILETGVVQSKGAYNLGEQEKGLTYYSVEPGQAGSYAAGFAPFNKQPGVDKPSYVIEVRDPERPGTMKRDTERGIPGTIVADDITAIYEAVPYTFREGEIEYVRGRGGALEEGSRYVPSGSVAWRKVDPSKLKKRVG